jgi:hypothetical protein
MAKTSTLGITVTVVGDGLNETLGAAPNLIQTINPSCPGALPVNVALSAGFNAIPVPPGAVAMLLIPPVGSVNAKTLKGVTGDTGFAMNPAALGIYPFVVGATTVGITSAGVETVQIGWI